MPKYLDQTGLATFKSKLDETYANKNNAVLVTDTSPITNAEIDELFPGSGNVVELNIHYSSTTAPSDISKLWVKTDVEPEKVFVSKDLSLGAETISPLDVTLPIATGNMACGVVGTKIYLFGGYGSGYSNKIYCFDATTNTISTLSATLPRYILGMACGVVGTKIYLFGGDVGSSSYVNTIFCFDTTTNTVSTLSTILPTAARDMTCGVVGTKIYLFGGRTGTSSGSCLNRIYCFDTAAETISTLSVTLPNGIAQMTCGVVGTKAYLFGGATSGGITVSSFSNKIYRFNTTTETISTLSVTLPANTTEMVSGAVGTKIYLFGGYNSSSSGGQNSYCFDTTTETISTLSATLPVPTMTNSSGVVGTKVYLFGGRLGAGNYVRTIYRFAVSFALAENNLLLLDNGSNSFNFVNNDELTIEAKPKQVYIGNANDEGTYVESALYINNAWQPIG